MKLLVKKIYSRLPAIFSMYFIIFDNVYQHASMSFAWVRNDFKFFSQILLQSKTNLESAKIVSN